MSITIFRNLESDSRDGFRSINQLVPSRILCCLMAVLGLVDCQSTRATTALVTSTDLHDTVSADTTPLFADAPEVLLGERLFFESRFSEWFWANSAGDANAQPPAIETATVLANDDITELNGGPRDGPISCRHCHIGDDRVRHSLLDQRAYNDFSPRSAIPRRSDGQRTTLRNSPIMASLTLPRSVPALFHYDGEFIEFAELVRSGVVGRNFGWLPGQEPTAKAHVARVIREDTGVVNTRRERIEGRGVPYRLVMAGGNDVPPSLRIPKEYRLDVLTSTDDAVLTAIGRLIHAYNRSLRFGTGGNGMRIYSPYELFLVRNHLPTGPGVGESPHSYATRLRTLTSAKTEWEWVSPEEHKFQRHRQEYTFGPRELDGLNMFLSRGGCVACHPPPDFTDYRFHNNGATQSEYDNLFGDGAFAALKVPGHEERSANIAAYLPPSAKHPERTGRFRAVPTLERPGWTDLGLWNVFGNPDLPAPQRALMQILCGPGGQIKEACNHSRVLPFTIAYFKTPSIRDLGHSNPYFHTGAYDSLEEVLQFYQRVSNLARGRRLRNASPELSAVYVDKPEAARALAAFLRALNEDYQ